VTSQTKLSAHLPLAVFFSSVAAKNKQKFRIFVDKALKLLSETKIQELHKEHGKAVLKTLQRVW